MIFRPIYIFSILVSFISTVCLCQNKIYEDSIIAYQNKYVQEHEVVTGNDKSYIHFYPVNEKFKVICTVEKKLNSPWFAMATSGPFKKNYRVYGTVHFKINDTTVILNIYQSQDLLQSQQYKEHLFIPFIDATSGEETYISGRYFDFTISDIINNQIVIDFNKAYNPYCAYVSGKYNCPIPPRENILTIAILAGEKAFSKPH